MNNQEHCPRIESLSALTDEELHETERAALEAHVAGCAICSPVLAELRELRSHFAALPEMTPDFDVAADVDRRIGNLTGAAPRRAPPPSRPRWWQVALLAPGGALAVATGLWFGGAMLPAMASARAPAVQMAAFSALPPGALCPAATPCAGTPR